jgi:hypothetical protein
MAKARREHLLVIRVRFAKPVSKGDAATMADQVLEGPHHPHHVTKAALEQMYVKSVRRMKPREGGTK